MKWFFCLNEGDWQFEMAQVAVHTARQNTKLEPVCIYDGRDKSVIEWMAAHDIPVIFHRSPLYQHACKVYEVEPGSHRSTKVTGAWMRIDIPTLTDEDFILYTDTDIMFLGDCSGLESIKPEYIAAVNDHNPLNSFNMNSGVLVMNCKNLRREYDEFIEFIKINMLKVWTTYDQTAYDQYYGHRTLRMPLEYNWKSFWEDNHAVWNPGIRIERTIPVQILHFTGTKPWDKTRYKEGMGLYRGPNNYPWQRMWWEFFNKVKLPDKPESAPTVKLNVLYPCHRFLHTPLIDNEAILEELIIDFGVNTVDSAEEYPETIRTVKSKLDLRIWQQPNQLASFMKWIFERKEQINNYTEVGVAYGGTFYTIDSYLRAINPLYRGGTAVDVVQRMVDLYIYGNKFTDVKFVQSKSVEYVPPEPIDLCFVDTYHTYDVVKAEYEHFKNHCKFIAFHDICGAGFPEMKTVWKEIKSKHNHWEFTQQYYPAEKDSMGIGVIEV